MTKSILSGLLVGFIGLTVTACRSSGSANIAEDRKKVASELGEETSLAADRSQLDELRKSVPEDTKKSNDELALYLQLMGQGTEQPQLVRDKFQALVRKKRDGFRDKVSKLRETYKRQETERRDGFLKQAKDKRDSFMKIRRTSQENRAFFADQDKERQRFFAEERDRRSNFEAEILGQSKDFDSYMREKSNEFNERYRQYSKQFSEKPKPKNAVTGDTTSAGQAPGAQSIDSVPAKAIGTEEN